MKSFRTATILVGFITMTGFWMPCVPATEVQHVQFGSTVTLGCNISYLYDTTWFKHNPNFPPTVVLCASLKDAQLNQGFQLNPRFSVELTNRSLALRITAVEKRDLGLYFCIASVNAQLKVGKGTMLQDSSPGSSWFLFQHGYCMGVGIVLLIMVLAVCTANWKAKSNKETANETPTANNTKQTKPLHTIHKQTTNSS